MKQNHASRLSRGLLAISCLALSLTVMAACAPSGSGDNGPTPVGALPDEPGDHQQADPAAPTVPPAQSTQRGILPGDASTDPSILSRAEYSFLDPNHEVPTQLLAKAVSYFDQYKDRFANQNYITVVNFSARSNVHRFFVINMATGEVFATVVAHGKGSDPKQSGYATVFSNSVGSNASSLGFFSTAETYSGKHGYSLMIDGLSETNSNVRKRVVVVHGADYVRDENVLQGRSFGCFALPMAVRSRVIDMIRGGSLIYAGLVD